MSADDIFADEDAVDADLDLLESLRLSRKQFLDLICDGSESKDENTLAILRLESTYQFAEFYYLLSARKINREDDIKMLADLHNQYIIELTKDRDKMARLGLSAERLLDAMFTIDTMPRLLQHWKERPGAIDQSNLARFLVSVMSTETCRKVVVAATAAGYLERQRTAYGTMLVHSTGKLERIFGRCMRELRQRIEARLVSPCSERP